PAFLSGYLTFFISFMLQQAIQFGCIAMTYNVPIDMDCTLEKADLPLDRCARALSGYSLYRVLGAFY
ncbi:MAG: hypothetical protein ACI8U0_002325, partial [Flavobacteriales bacterium]